MPPQRLALCVLWAGLIAALTALAPTIAQPLDDHDLDAYVAAVKAERADTDAEFRAPRTSPLDPRSRLLFERLDYFPIDPAYRLAAEVEWIEEGEIVEMLAADSTTVEYRIAAELRFTLADTPQTLTAYASVETVSDSLFVPFRDATTGQTTFSGGRRLSVPHPGTGAETADLDFNKAFNPSCAYSPIYPCLILPPEHELSVAVEAGVRKPQQFLIDAFEAPLPDTWQASPVADTGYELDAPFEMSLEFVPDDQGVSAIEGALSAAPFGFVVFGAALPMLRGATEEERAQLADLLLAALAGFDDGMEVEDRWTEMLPAGRAVALAASSKDSDMTMAVRFLIFDELVLMLGVIDMGSIGWAADTEERTAVAQRYFESLRLVSGPTE